MCCTFLSLAHSCVVVGFWLQKNTSDNNKNIKKKKLSKDPFGSRKSHQLFWVNRAKRTCSLHTAGMPTTTPCALLVPVWSKTRRVAHRPQQASFAPALCFCACARAHWHACCPAYFFFFFFLRLTVLKRSPIGRGEDVHFRFDESLLSRDCLVLLSSWERVARRERVLLPVLRSTYTFVAPRVYSVLGASWSTIKRREDARLSP